jgi:hypothetical protein
LPALEGFQRVQWIYFTGQGPANPYDAPVGFLSLMVDFDDVYTATTGTGAPGSYTVTGNMATLATAPTQIVDFRHKLIRQKCKSIAFTFYEPAVTGYGLTGMTALTLRVGVKRGTNKLPAGKTLG